MPFLDTLNIVQFFGASQSAYIMPFLDTLNIVQFFGASQRIAKKRSIGACPYVPLRSVAVSYEKATSEISDI